MVTCIVFPQVLARFSALTCVISRHVLGCALGVQLKYNRQIWSGVRDDEHGVRLHCLRIVKCPPALDWHCLLNYSKQLHLNLKDQFFFCFFLVCACVCVCGGGLNIKNFYSTFMWQYIMEQHVFLYPVCRTP